MEDRILLNPDNRMLGTSSGDLGLYGGQTDPSVTIREARDDSTDLPQSSAPDGSSSGTGSPAGTSQNSSEAAAPESADMLSAGGGSAPASFLISPPAAAFQPAHVQPESGSGTVSVTPVAPTGFMPEGQAAQAATQDTPLGDVAGTAPVQGLDPVIDAAPVASVLDALALDAGGPLAPIVTTAGDVAASTVGSVTSTVSPLVEAGAGAVSSVTDTVADVVTATVAAVDDLSDLPGADPAGGVATLVSLVSVSEMFDLNPVEAPASEDIGDPGFAMLDALADDPSDSLLGADDHGANDHHADFDHPLGL